ncbi:hypothetical protein FACS189461_3640 [Spirochaetia bacterium]|nr:hypothetical protein FACS189461_3640 [Spirochaetia bacterium]
MRDNAFYRIANRLFNLLFQKKLKKACAYFGKNARIDNPEVISERHLLSIGDNTTILSHSRLQCYSALVTETPHIKIGNNCYIGYYLTILAGADVIIDDWVLIASNVLISSENHGMDPESETPYMDQTLTCAPVHIEEGCWISEKVSILPGVTIGKKSIIGAGSVVTKSIPAYSIAVGNPARVIKKYNFLTHGWE